MVLLADTAHPLWASEDVSDQLGSFLAAGAPNAMAIVEHFLSYLEHADETCPAGVNSSFEVPLGCTTEEGYVFSGIGWYFPSDFIDDSDTVLSWYHGGDFEMLAPSGATMAGGGEITYSGVEEDDGTVSFEIDFKGSWLDEDASDDWLARFYSGLYLASGSGGDGERIFTLDGGQAISDQRVHFHDVVFVEDSACPWDPVGVLSVRDDRGYWYDLPLTADCDPCAEVTFQATGESVGDVCLDLAPYGAALFLGHLPR